MTGQSPDRLPWATLFARLPIDPNVEGDVSTPPLGQAATAAAVAAGGVAGSLSRAWVSLALPHPSSQWPWSTLVVNWSGSALLAFLLVMLTERFPRSRLPRPLLGTGVLGGYTTFSTFSVDVVQMARHGHGLLAGGYVLASVAGGGACAVVAIASARAVDRLGDRQRWQARADAHLAATPASEAESP